MAEMTLCGDAADKYRLSLGGVSSSGKEPLALQEFLRQHPEITTIELRLDNDAKGRMAIPAKMRAQLGEGMVMARGQERCVYLLPQSEFRRIAAQIQRVSVGNKAARQYLRVFLSGAVDQDTDKQGRVVVPQMLREYADLGDDIVVIGVGTRAEIWNRKAWEQYLSDNEPEYSDIADDVLPDLEF